MNQTNKKKKVLVVGGTGFIGYHLIKFLLKKDFFVDSVSTKKPKKIRKVYNVNYILCDISNKRNLNKLKKNKYDHIVNLGGYVDHSNKKMTYRSHYLGCKNLYNYFKNTKIKTFVQIGSSLEYGKIKSPQIESKFSKPLSIYANSKLLATKFLIKKFKKYLFPVVILRGYQVYGPKQDNNRLISTVINNSLNNLEFACTEGTQKRDFLHVDDFISAIYKSLNNKKAIGNIINVGFGKPIKVKDIIIKIVKIIKKGKANFGKIKIRKDEIMILYPSIKKAAKLLKWKPIIQLNKGLRKTIIDYKNLK